MSEKITGPLGFWTFPILNLIYGLIQSQPQSPSTQSEITNTEKWSWTDYKGIKQEITVNRQKKINTSKS